MYVCVYVRLRARATATAAVRESKLSTGERQLSPFD